MLKELALNKFAQELASESPAPGGGSVAGLSGSLACALTSMVMNLTIDNKSSEGYSEELIEKLKEVRSTCDEARVRFLDLVDEDTLHFNQFMDALKMPKNTDEEKAERKVKLDKAKELILKTPETMALEAAKLYDAIELAEEHGNQNAVSDAGVAALMLDSAIKAALLNVKINLPMVKDEKRKAEVEKEVSDLIALTEKRSKELFNKVWKKLD